MTLFNRTALRKWFQTPAGRALLEEEQDLLSRILPSIFGYHCLQITDIPSYQYTQSSLIPNHIRLGRQVDRDFSSSQIQGYPELLPILPHQLDLVVLTHTLDQSPQMSEVLQRIYQSIRPDGYIIVLGFNPWSLWGLWRWIKLKQNDPVWSLPFVHSQVVENELIQHGCLIHETQRYFYRWPWGKASANFGNKLGPLKSLFPWMSGGYVIVAQKKMTTLTQVRHSWRKPERVLMPKLASPAPNSRQAEKTVHETR